ncbi:unnamed protein product [Paramecium octaurelia]|uniref:Uncharacterized protein n=1 Tax=Paramecium octaurelia TaxID=43137 RepID=A0A8S1WXX6_PAROT|nr:unnamed protein product [Paramecium octaurelia]
MKYFILTLFVLNAFSFSLNDDWDGMEEAVKVQQDAVLDLVDQLDLYSETPITTQIENQVQQLMNPPLEADQAEKENEQSEEVHSLEYWLERLGDEYQDETILLQQPQSITEQITTVVGNLVLKVGDANQLKLIAEQAEIADPLIIDGIELEYQDKNGNENVQMQQLLNSALEMQKSLSQEDEKQQNDLNSNSKKKHKKKRPIIDIDLNDITMSEDDDQNEIEKTIVQENDTSENTIEVQIDSNNEEPSTETMSKFTPNEETISEVQDNSRMYNFLNDVHEDAGNEDNQVKQQPQKSYNFKEYSFNKFEGDQRSFYNDNDDSTLKVVEREQPKEIINNNNNNNNNNNSNNNQNNNNNNNYNNDNNNYNNNNNNNNNNDNNNNNNNNNGLQFQEENKSYKFINKEQSEQNQGQQSTLNNQEQPQETSILKKYLLYTDQPEVISTGTTEKEIEDDKKLVAAFKSMDRDEHWEKTNKKQKINTDVRNELLRFTKVDEEPQKKEPEFKEVTESKVENPHKFISFKADPQYEQAENAKKKELAKSKYDELPETKLQSKEDMKREKQQKIQEMQKIIEEQLKNKTLKKKSETDKSLQYESEYLQWERATQAKSYPAEINFVMTQNNLRKRQ